MTLLDTRRRHRVRRESVLTVAWASFVFSVLLAVPEAACGQQPSAIQAVNTEQLAGNYQLPDGTVLGINSFSGGDGPPAPLFTDYTTGIVRTLFPLQDDRFAMGPSVGVQSPVERTVRTVRDGGGAIVGIALQRPGEDEIIAKRLPADAREVEFKSEDATLAGTLLMPATPGPHPAIVLLHGSGPLTRYSFGPYPRFFASLGLAVLIYDKRGAGASTGTFFTRTAFYPEQYLRDAVAAVKFLKARGDINPRQIGVWGTSEGGMLTTKFESFAIEVMRTGKNWDEYERAQATAVPKKWWSAYFGSWKGFSSLEDIRWQWEHAYRFDPRPSLQAVKCPVLGLFGALDTSTPAQRAASNLEDGLRTSGNGNVTIRIFEQGNHPLMDARTGGNAEIPGLTRMLPGVFETLRMWLSSRITPAR